jgi:hypothetical protein
LNDANDAESSSLSSSMVEEDEAAVAVLGPTTGNVHRIEALSEYGAAFLDLLVPGYKQPRACRYFVVENEEENDAKNGEEEVGQQQQQVQVGQLVWLRQIPEPNILMQPIPYVPPFFE